MNSIKLLFLVTLFCLQYSFSLAQIYPVNLTTQSIPPHTGNISDWTAPGSNRLSVNILLKDANEVNFQARLKVTIEGQGITLRSKNNLAIAPIELRYGAPLQLNSPDLASLLHYENLNYENYSIQQYEANGGLPDGMYQVCFQVFDYDRVEEEAASFESCVSIMATLHKTPVILAPIGKIDPLYPQFIPVQWQSRHTGGFPTAYNVEIYEFDQGAGLTPELLVDFEQALVTKSVTNIKSSIIDISDPQLIPGREYIIRVQAEDITQQNGFKNNGWSDYEIFTYGEDSCPAPFNIKVIDIDDSSAKISWDPIPGTVNNSYVLKYRNKNRSNSKWYEDETIDVEYEIKDLRENTTYEYQVYTICNGNLPGILSPIDTFNTDTIPVQLDCGDPNSLPLITNQNLVDSLEEDMIITIADFKIYIDTIAEQSGLWTGEGKIQIPWINTYVNVEFEDLAINTDLEIFGGTVNAISDGLDELPGFITAADLASERGAPEIQVCEEETLAENNASEADNTEEESAEPDQENEEDESYLFVAGAGIGATNLPFGLTSISTTNTYIIALDSMVFTPQGASLKAYMALDVPSGGGDVRHLVFTGENNFHLGGLIGESKLFLEETVQAQLQSKTRFSFIGGNDSYVSWDCQGFKSVSLEGAVEFCRDMIIPINPLTGEASPIDYVTGSFVTTMPEWGDFVATISVSPFALTQLPDWKWEVQNMIFDYSDATTPELIAFPEGYKHTDVIDSLAAENYPSWTGFFLESATVTLPNSLTGVEDGDEVTIGGKNMIIDNTGFSAGIYGTDLLPLEKGRMGTWAFSIDSLGISIQSNHFENVGFAGEVDVPAFEKEFGYEAFIDPADEYFFKVIWNDTLSLDAFKAKVELHASSAIELKYNKSEKKYYSEAVLHGLASFQPKTSGGNGLNIPYLTFQNMKIMTDDPYVELGSWQLEGDLSANFGMFDLTLCGFGITKDEITNEVIIGFCAKVHLTSAAGGELAGDGFFRIIADIKYSETLRRQIWAFKDFKVDKLGLDASGTGYAFTGDVEFFEKDPTYGTGFRGAIEATFEPRVKVGAVAQFGTVSDYRYFFADALASYNPGIAIGTSGLMLYGFGGGASYHMARTGFEKIVMPQEGNNPVAPEGVGVSLSGMKYIPNKNVGVGIKATVALGTVNRTLFNGIATLEFIFNNAGGLHQIGFDGTGKFLTQPSGDPKLSCNLNMTYDFPAESFHASLDLFVNVENQITGAYDNNFAGNGTLHIDLKDWYMYIGTPDAPISLALNTDYIPKLDPVKISFGGYFDTGTIIPDFPGLPSNVTSILGDYSITKRDDPRFGGGKGMIFGANIKADLLDLEYGLFFASLKAGAGWDMMLFDYGTNARCSFNPTAPSTIGIDGWYGTGQMYAYITGNIGIQVDLFAVKGRFNILSIGAAAALQARLPNPMYLRGKVGGEFSILNGLVKGNCSFEFESGELCEVVGQDVLGVELISDMSPNLNSNKEVDVFIKPQVTFNMKIDDIFSLENPDGKVQYYRTILKDFSLINTDTGAPVAGEIVWGTEKEVLGFKTPDVLAPLSNFKMSVTVRVETKFPETEWGLLKDTFGDVYEQSKEVTFSTGVAPNYIPLSNVAYSYPIHTQLNFHKNESPNGYVKLIRGQPYLFDGTNGGDWVQKIRFIQNERILKQIDFNYNVSAKQLNFQIPGEILENDQITQVTVVAIPTSSEAVVNDNVTMKETTLVYNQGADGAAAESGEDFTSILIKQRALENQAQNLNEEVMLALNFRVSKYNSFKEKMDAISKNRDWRYKALFSGVLNEDGSSKGSYLDKFGLEWIGDEMFDKFEMYGYFNAENEYVKPLVELEADMGKTGAEWFDSEIYPQMIQKFPVSTYPITWRDPDELGAVPNKALYLKQWAQNDRVLTEQEIRSNTVNPGANLAIVSYEVPFELAADYFEYRTLVALKYTTNKPPAMDAFMAWDYQQPYQGNYEFNIKYRKPGAAPTGNNKDLIRF